MKNTKHALVGSGLVVVMAACAPAPDDVASSGSALRHTFAPGVHAMPLRSPGAAALQTAPPHLVSYGGPVIPNVKVYAVFWGPNVAFQEELGSFYAAIPNSTYFDWLNEYDTTGQHIGRGSFGGKFVITPSNTGTRLEDADVQAEISAQMDAGALPPTDGVDTLYMLHFPRGITLFAPHGQGESCVAFCAYHGTFKRGDQYVFYGVHPDIRHGGCNTGCGTGSVLDKTTQVASHELVEAVTDAAVGVATDIAPPLAWYDRTNGEIADICVGQSARVGDFSVQLLWSNAQMVQRAKPLHGVGSIARP
jgi:hypothetical protein